MNIDLSKDIYDGEEKNNGTEESRRVINDNNNDDTFVIDTNFNPSPATNVPAIAIKKENARSQIAFLYVSSFLGIILVVFLYAVIRALEINNIKDLLITVSGIMSGPLGFIIGYYFKSEDDNSK